MDSSKFWIKVHSILGFCVTLKMSIALYTRWLPNQKISFVLLTIRHFLICFSCNKLKICFANFMMIIILLSSLSILYLIDSHLIIAQLPKYWQSNNQKSKKSFNWNIIFYMLFGISHFFKTNITFNVRVGGNFMHFSVI